MRVRGNMKIFVIGDHKTGTGPANATAGLLNAMPEGTMYLERTGKAGRFFEIAFLLPFCDVVLLSGHSKQNLWAIRLAGIFKKQVLFWMHGCVEYENEINCDVDESMTAVERQVLEKCDRILAVSPAFEEWLKDRYPAYRGKIDCLPNGLDRELFENVRSSRKMRVHEDMSFQIMCVGGGMKRKRIARVCEAVTLLNKDGVECRLVIAGAKGADQELIENCPYADYRGLLSKEETTKLMEQSDLFVQNSCFETFGLAPIEALMAGCDLLMSAQTGALCLFDKGVVISTDLIEDTEDGRHIADRMLNVLKNHNGKRLLSGIDIKKHSWENTVKRLFELAGKEE